MRLLLTFFLLNSIVASGQNASKVYDYPDIEASFPRGLNGLQNWVLHAIYYPREARINREEGTVYVAITIETDGHVSQMKILQSVSPTIDKTIQRIRCGHFRWTPAQVNGQAVRSRVILPITFQLI
jgi:protein TonB